MSYAIVESGGKQYRAVPGETIEVDRLPNQIGDSVTLDVLLLADGDQVSVGTPYVEKAVVQASVVAQIKAPKVVSFKYSPKKRIRRRRGHRQQYTRLQIHDIKVEG
ncbi:MAG: 50S ribosomal protein L21 [Anaerolineales bacterium]